MTVERQVVVPERMMSRGSDVLAVYLWQLTGHQASTISTCCSHFQYEATSSERAARDRQEKR
jgi:hypothetical protein